MTCCTVNNCTSCLHCGPACDCKGYHHLQMSLDTSHKISEQPSLIFASFFPDSFLVTEEFHVNDTNTPATRGPQVYPIPSLFQPASGHFPFHWLQIKTSHVEIIFNFHLFLYIYDAVLFDDEWTNKMLILRVGWMESFSWNI